MADTHTGMEQIRAKSFFHHDQDLLVFDTTENTEQSSSDLISDSLEEPMKRLLWLLPRTEPLLNVND